MCSKNIDTLWENPLISTLFLASSHMSQELSFHTWAAMLYSSIKGSYVQTIKQKNSPQFKKTQNLLEDLHTRLLVQL